jgi:hypothetical protein
MRSTPREIPRYRRQADPLFLAASALRGSHAIRHSGGAGLAVSVGLNQYLYRLTSRKIALNTVLAVGAVSIAALVWFD